MTAKKAVFSHPASGSELKIGQLHMATPMVLHTVRELVSQAVQQAQNDGLLQLETTPEIQIERPGKLENGDFATSLPLRLARATRINPLQLAESLVQLIPACDEIEKVVAAHPGFINFYLKDSWVQKQVEEVRRAGNDYGSGDLGQGQKMMVEYVSVNPTGPVHVGHARGAVLGSALANILSAAGYRVTQEYYVNDAGTQMQAFYGSVYARYLQSLGQEAEMPANGYAGEYIADLAEEIAESEGTRFIGMDEAQALREMGDIAREKMIDLIRDDLTQIGVGFDNWFSERTLFDQGDYDRALQVLKDKEFLSERENAVWFNSTQLGDDKDNVVIRSSGEPTYFASDIAYHYNKFVVREFQSVVDIWGADHQGHVPRMKSAVAALGIEPERLTVLISQMVTLKRGDEVVRASKRTGDFVTLRELTDEVGADACRYFFLARTPSTQMEFDLELAKQESSENPVYYVQYGHARIASILNSAREQNIDWSAGDVSLLTHPSELSLIRTMLRLPELVEQMARALEPHQLPHYTMELATAFHWFYENCRVISSHEEDAQMNLARLKLVESAQIVFRRSLELMGMSAPERM